MAIKFSQFNLRTDHTSGMHLVGYDGNQNIHITVDNLFDDFINGTENTIAMFGTDGTVLADSILLQDAGATVLTVSGQLNVDAAATFDTSITVTGDSTLNGNVILGDASADLITQTGTLYLNGPVKDTTDTLGGNDEILVSDGNGELNFQKLSETHVRSSEIVVQSIKANEALTKGDPVYIVDFQVGQEVNIVAKADASNPAKMPASGIIDEDYANQAFGTMTAFGSFNTNFDASGGSENWSIGDILFVKAGGGLTNIKPTGSDLIQNVAIVSRNHQQTGELEVVALGRTNDIPNLTPGRLWVGSTGNTIESQTLFVDEASGEVGIGTASPSYTADIAGTLRSAGQAFFADLGPVSVAQLGGGSSTTSQFNIISTAGGGGFIAATNTLSLNANNIGGIKIQNTGGVQFNQYGSGTFTGTDTYNLSVDSSGNIIETNPAVDGSGTLNYVSKWTPDGDTLGDSQIFDNGTNVGIGTTTPNTSLEVDGAIATTTSDYVQGSTGSRLLFETSGSGNTHSYIQAQSSGGTSNVEDLALQLYGGNVGIGTDSPGEKLEVVGNAILDNSNAKLKIKAGGTGTAGSIDFTFDTDSTQYGLIDLNYNLRASQGFRIKSLYPMTLDAVTAQKFLISGSEKMRIDSSGEVGIGTTNPGAKLDINNDVQIDTYSAGTTIAHNAGYIKLLSDAKSGWGPGDELGKIEFYSKDTSGIGTRNAASIRAVNNQGNGSSTTTFEGELAFYTSLYNTAEAEAVRIDSAGNVGIGTSSPNAKLDVNGGIRMANDSSTASVSNVGTFRYRSASTGMGTYASYVDMCMQTGATTYAWVNIVQNNW